MIVDSHCHLDQLDLSSHDGKLESVLKAAKQNDVGHIHCPSVNISNFPTILNIVQQYSNKESNFPAISCSIALHPSEQEEHEPTVDELIALADQKDVLGIGETGLDYHYDFVDQEEQRTRFRRHIQAAVAVKKPLIVHMRESVDDVFKLIEEEGGSKVGGVMHCFTESWEVAQRAMDLNFLISFSGIVTFKKALEIKEVAKKVPLTSMLIETDAPYLSPVPVRSKSNEPAFVRYIAEYLAVLKGVSYQTIADQTTQNYFRLFNPC